MTSESVIADGIEHLKEIENDLEEIKERTGNPRRSFVNGIFQGAGAIVGSIIALALLGILLSVLGVIPGFDIVTEYFKTLEDKLR